MEHEAPTVGKLGPQLRDGIEGGARLIEYPFSFRTGGMQDATMFSAKTIIFRAIIPLLCCNHLPADFEKPLLDVFAHFSPVLALHREHPVNLGRLMFTSWLRWGQRESNHLLVYRAVVCSDENAHSRN